MKRMKYALALLLAVVMMTIAGLSAVAAEPTLDDRIQSAIVYTKDNFAADFDPATGYMTADMWSLFCAMSAGKSADPDYAFLIPDYTEDDLSALATVSDYAKAVISSTLLGEDATDCFGVNLIEKLIVADNASVDANDWQNAANVVPYTVIALELSGAEYDKTLFTDRLHQMQKTDGGFSWDSTAETGDVDTTAMVVAALGLMETGEAVMDDAIEFILSTEDENGYFVSPGGTEWEGVFYPNVANANSQAMGLIALTTADQYPTDAQLNALLTLQTAEGGFVYDGYSEFPDYYSTHQALIALKCVASMEVDETPDSSTEEKPEEDASENESLQKPTTTAPKTGDDRLTKVMIFGGVALLAVAAIVVCVVLPAVQKKKKDDEEA